MRRLKKTIKIVHIVLAVVILIGTVGAIVMSNADRKLSELYNVQICDVDLASVPDGKYEGTHKVFPISAVVEVTVKEHKITGIDLVKHQNGQGGAAEAIPGKVVEAQSLQVDAVSGATLSSKVILLAIEDALKNATVGDL